MATRNLTRRLTFTDKSLKALRPKAHLYREYDGLADPLLKGFGANVTPKGTVSFFLSYTSPETGKRRFGAIGIYPSVTLKAAREQARTWRAGIAQGIDPVEQQGRDKEALDAKKQKMAQQQRDEEALGTVEDLFRVYTDDLELDDKTSVVEIRRGYDRDIGPVLGAMKARDVTTDHVADLHAQIVERGAPRLADVTRGWISAAFRFGKNVKRSPRWRKKAPDFAITVNPATEVQTAQKRRRVGQRHLSREELRVVWQRFGQPYRDKWNRQVMGLPSIPLAFRMIAATGQRVEEVLGARWAEFDVEDRCWAIPAERRKNRSSNETMEPHLVPLASLHLRLLDELRTMSTGELLFPAEFKDGPVSQGTVRMALRRYLERTGDVAYFSPRDLRRTWKTLAGSIGIDLEIRNRIQGHAMDDIGSIHYDRYDYWPEKQRAMARWASWLEALVAEPVRLYNVVKLAR